MRENLARLLAVRPLEANTDSAKPRPAMGAARGPVPAPEPTPAALAPAEPAAPGVDAPAAPVAPEIAPAPVDTADTQPAADTTGPPANAA